MLRECTGLVDEGIGVSTIGRLMPKVWRFLPHDESRVRQICAQMRVSPLMSQVLIARGMTERTAALEFLEAKLLDLHEPELLPGIPAAADRVVEAINAKRRITIYGDYDVDGVTATSLLWQCLKLAGAEVDYYIPSRLEEGYGLNCDAVLQLHKEDPDRLLVTVDCGIASVGEVAVARDVGLELIITDHHQFADQLPAADCLVHPRLPGGEYPFGDLCGAGVAFKLAWAVSQRLGDGKKASPQMREFLKSAVVLASIGTIADVVPLLGENRALVRYGLAAFFDRPSLGLKALMKVAKLDDKPVLDAEDIGFGIAPRINAAGRLGQARLAVELLTTQNNDRATALADYLDQLNNNRRTVERRMLKQAKQIVGEHPEWDEHGALVLSHPDWHAGVIGIVANRVAEHFEKPTILVSMNAETQLGQGSGRSFAGFDLHAGLSACSEYLETFGGHAAAAGLRVTADNIDPFRDELSRFIDQNHEVNRRDLELRIDAEVRLGDCTPRAVRELDRLGPFGQCNPRPIFAATGVELAEPPRKMGEGDRHLALRVRQFGATLRAVAFGRGEWADEIAQADGSLSISFAPSINRFGGRENVELKLIDWQRGGPTDAVQPPAASAAGS